MQTNTIHIDGQAFLLGAEEDVAGLKARIVAAASEGAAFIDFDSVDRGTVSVLVTPGMGVRFETGARRAGPFGEWEPFPAAVPDAAGVDVDRYYEQYVH